MKYLRRPIRMNTIQRIAWIMRVFVFYLIILEIGWTLFPRPVERAQLISFIQSGVGHANGTASSLAVSGTWGVATSASNSLFAVITAVGAGGDTFSFQSVPSGWIAGPSIKEADDGVTALWT